MMHAIDLGLSVKWADRNLGANSPDEVGDLYAWGEIHPKSEYTWDNYSEMVEQGKYGPYKEYHFRSRIYKIDKSHDAMNFVHGDPWRMPTSDEFKELINNCRWVYTNESKSNGYRIYGKNGNYIYLPAYGMPIFLLKYWSANRTHKPQHAEILELYGKNAPYLFCDFSKFN